MEIYLKARQNKWGISSSVFRHYSYAYKTMYFNYHSKQNLDWNYSRYKQKTKQMTILLYMYENI